MMENGSEKTLDAVGLGVAVRDLTVLLDSFPRPDAKVRARDFAESGGGPVPTALVTMARLGARTAFAGVVGDDPAGSFLVEGLEREGVDVSAVARKADCPTPASLILVEKEGRRTVCEWRQSDLPFREEDLERITPLLGRTRLLLVDARLSRVQLEAARRVRRAGGLVMLDCGHPRAGVEDLLRESDIAILSHSYPRELQGDRFAPEAFALSLAAGLAPSGPGIAGVTLGARGCVIASGGETFRIPGHRVTAIDTTGAGDVFHGAFAHALLRGEDPLQAARFANAAAALKCLGLTGRAPIPPEAEIRGFEAASHWE